MSGPATTSPTAAATGQRAELILQQLDQLPTLPAVAMRLLQATLSPGGGAAELAAIIETDQALTAKVLALVRRAHLGVREVHSVQRAIVLLGFTTLRNLALTVQVHETLSGLHGGTEAALDRAAFWKHNLAVGCAAEAIAQRMTDAPPPQEAFVSGLLHDLGKAALDACLPKSYARVLERTHATGRGLCEIEHEVLGLDHTIAGKRLAVRWQLPRAVAESIWLHHHPPSALPGSIETRRGVQIVHLADQFIRFHRIGFSGNPHLDHLDAVAREIGFDPAAFPQVLAAVTERLEQDCCLVGIDALTGTELYMQAVADANAELGRLNESLLEANRRLTGRSRCLDALTRFAASLTPTAPLGEVCRAAAACACDALEVDTALVFAFDPCRGMLYVGGMSPDGPHTDAFTAEDAAPPGASQPPSRPPPAPTPLPLAGGLFQLAQLVLRRCVHWLGPATPWMGEIAPGGPCIGGVMVPETSRTSSPENGSTAGDRPARNHAHRLPPEETDWSALCAAFGLALTSALERAQVDRLNEELSQVSRQLHEAHGAVLRARAVGMIAEVAAGAAHELNNPLAVISGRAQMLAKLCTEPDHERHARIIQEHAQRASDIVSELVHFAKPDPPKPAAIALHAWLPTLCQQWEERSSLRCGQLRWSLSDPAVRICADPEQLRHIFGALLANALEATTPESARLLINSASTSSDDTIVITVEDNGVGMAPDVLEHAADPFFSHRSAGRGRGMGLSQATRLATNNGGRLWLQSSPGNGTTVFLELPAVR